MLDRLLSADPPRSRILALLLVAILAGLIVTPFALHSAQANAAAVHICVFILLVASYDLLLGYGGIVSFAHTMFFGIGGYGAGLALAARPSWAALAAGSLAALVLAVALALVIGLLSLRVRALFFAMVTLAVAAVFGDLASRLSWLTGGEDGTSFELPALLRPATRLLDQRLWGVAINGRLLTYYLILLVTAGLFLLLLRLVNSPFGRVLLAIRENEFRAEAIGYRTALYRTAANAIAAAVAAVAGMLLSLWLRYTGPASTLSFDIMIDILLMLVIGGQGSLYGAVIGATLVVIAQTYLRPLLGGLQADAAGLGPLAALLDPDRWRLWLGLLFILCVYLFPEGIVGRLRSLEYRKHRT
jgi:branched-chain amino acid transport system permease protein